MLRHFTRASVCYPGFFLDRRSPLEIRRIEAILSSPHGAHHRIAPTKTAIERSFQLSGLCCAACGAEFTYMPDCDWVKIVLSGRNQTWVFEQDYALLAPRHRTMPIGFRTSKHLTHSHRSGDRGQGTICPHPRQMKLPSETGIISRKFSRSTQ